jgi:hypothetical protein
VGFDEVVARRGGRREGLLVRRMYASAAHLQLKRRTWGWGGRPTQIQGGTVNNAGGWPADVAEREREGLMRLPDREGLLCLGAQGDSDHPAPGSVSFIWAGLCTYTCDENE